MYYYSRSGVDSKSPPPALPLPFTQRASVVSALRLSAPCGQRFVLPASARAPCPRPSTHQSCRARPCSPTPRGPTRPCKTVETASLGRYVRTTQTNAAAIRLLLRHRAALGKRAGLSGAVSGLNGRQPRENALVRPWWLISTMLFVTVSSKPICQKLSCERQRGARTREISHEIICRSAGP